MRIGTATVAILGGGPAGASAALELARLGIDTLLIEQSDGSGNPVGECLAPSANPLLQQLGIADLLQASGALPSYGNRSAWGGDGSVADRDFLRDPHGHGWHLDRPAFNRALLAAAETTGAAVLRHHRITAIERTSENWLITTQSPDGEVILRATLLVDATGRRALLARHERIRHRAFDSQVAAVAFLHPDSHAAPLHDATTTIEAAEHGWWYAALLPDRRLAVAWFTDPELLAEQSAWRPEAWWNLLRASDLVGNLVASYVYGRPERIDIFSARSSLLTNPTGDGWIAAGDAAAAYDPLSSHGIGSALAGGRTRRPHRRRNPRWRSHRLPHLPRPPPRRLHPLPLHPPRLLRRRTTLAHRPLLVPPPRNASSGIRMATKLIDNARMDFEDREHPAAVKAAWSKFPYQEPALAAAGPRGSAVVTCLPALATGAGVLPVRVAPAAAVLGRRTIHGGSAALHRNADAIARDFTRVAKGAATAARRIGQGLPRLGIQTNGRAAGTIDHALATLTDKARWTARDTRPGVRVADQALSRVRTAPADVVSSADET